MKHTAPFPCPRLALMLPVALLAAACRSQSAPIQTRGAVADAVGTAAVRVQPLEFRWKEPAWRAVELSQRLVNVARAQAGDSARSFGPTELRVTRPGDGAPPREVEAPLASHGVRPEGVLVLRPWAEHRVPSGERELIDTEGYTVGQRATEVVRYVGRVEVLHPATRQGVLEVFGEATVNPYTDTLEASADPVPELARLMEALTREALRGLSSHLKPPRAPSPALAWAPWNVLDAAAWLSKGWDPESPPALQEAGQDPVRLRVQRLRSASPDVDAARLETLARLRPDGLHGRAAPEGAKRSAEHLVLTLDGRPALPQSLARARMALVPVEARVQQPSGRILPLVLP